MRTNNFALHGIQAKVRVKFVRHCSTIRACVLCSLIRCEQSAHKSLVEPQKIIAADVLIEAILCTETHHLDNHMDKPAGHLAPAGFGHRKTLTGTLPWSSFFNRPLFTPHDHLNSQTSTLNVDNYIHSTWGSARHLATSQPSTCGCLQLYRRAACRTHDCYFLFFWLNNSEIPRIQISNRIRAFRIFGIVENILH